MAILVSIVSWKQYLFALLPAGADAPPRTVGATRFPGGLEPGAEYGVVAAHSALIVAPVILVSPLAIRLIVSCMTAGAVES